MWGAQICLLDVQSSKQTSTPLEVAAAKVCRAAMGKVATNVRLRDMNLNGIRSRDGRNVKVVANILPLWGGAQLVVDVTFASCLKRNGYPQPRMVDNGGANSKPPENKKTMPIRR
jgi:hypothetical protein